MDNDSIKAVRRLVYWHDYGIYGDVSKRSLRRMLSEFGAENFQDYLAIRYADICGQSDHLKEEKIKNTESIKKLYDEIIRDKDCFTVKQLDITGKDIMELGIPAGPKIGEILNYLLERVMDDPSLNENDKLKHMIEEHLSNGEGE